MIRLESTLAAPSHSRLAKLHDCRRAYYYRYVRKLRARGSSTRQIAGKALHAAFDVLYRKGFDAIEEAHRAIIREYGDHVPGERFAYLTVEHLMGIMVQYVHRWSADDADEVIGLTPLRLHCSQIEGNPAILTFAGDYDEDGYAILAESPMIVRISDTLAMTVIIDLIVKRADGTIWVVDHKNTAAWLGKGVQNKYLVSHQLPLYVLAVRAMLGRCDGALINAIYMGEQALSTRSKAVKFDRYVFDYTDGQLAESEHWAQHTLFAAVDEEAIGESVDGDDERWWLQNPSAYCAGCDYLQLCEVGPAMRAGRAVQWYDHDDDTGGGDGEGSEGTEA